MSASLQSKIESRFPDPDQRQAVLTAFAEAIQKAIDISQGQWIVRKEGDKLMLNVTNLIIFEIYKDCIWLSLDEASLAEQGIEPAEAFPNWEEGHTNYPVYKRPPSVNGYYHLTPDDPHWAQVQQLHFKYMERLVGVKTRIGPGSVRSHDISIIAFLNNNLQDRQLPLHYTGIPSDKDSELKAVVNRYTTYVENGGLEDETYKFDLIQENWGLPDLQATDFAASVNQINFHNLLDWRAAAGMKQILEADPEGYRQVLANLFNEELPLEERLDAFRTGIDNLVERAGLSLGTPGNDERTASVLLTFKYPETYRLYKHQFYSHFCQFLGISTEKPPHKYPHYLQLVNQAIEDYLAPEQRLLDTMKAQLDYEQLGAAQMGLIGQDFLYQSFDKSKEEVTFREDEEAAAGEEAEPATGISKNQILFGPPGTGKTYQTIRQAVDIIHPGFAEGRSRAAVKTEFERLEQEGRLQFTTFHQSMTYEDFIEGIKPNLSGSEEADVAYKIEDGIFKQMAIDAGFALARANEAHAASSTLSFTDAYDNLLQDIEEHLSAGKDFTIQSKTGRTLFVDHITNQRNIAFNHAGSDRCFVVSKERLTKIHNAFEDTDLTAISNINKAFRGVIGGNDSTLYWAVLVAIRNHYLTAGQQEQADWENYGPEDRKAAVQKLSKEELSTSDAEPYVLIIDEINRGNIAEILGELITLLEPDKRLGEDEELTVRLPYSRESFAVPPNLYVLGTMNTADRSVEALDTALRRRFDFQEITPDPERIREHRNAETIPIADEAISLPELLSTLNQRIEKLLDKDHLIGHSYFFHVAGFEDLKRVFQHNILPLLQEYFYGDFSKIGLVVGEGFVVQNEDPVTFARFPHEDRDEMARQPVIQVRDVEAMDDHAFAEALAQLLNKSGGNGRAE